MEHDGATVQSLNWDLPVRIYCHVSAVLLVLNMKGVVSHYSQLDLPVAHSEDCIQILICPISNVTTTPLHNIPLQTNLRVLVCFRWIL